MMRGDMILWVAIKEEIEASESPDSENEVGYLQRMY